MTGADVFEAADDALDRYDRSHADRPVHHRTALAEQELRDTAEVAAELGAQEFADRFNAAADLLANRHTPAGGLR